MRRALISTDASTHGRPHPEVLREVARLGGVTSERFEPIDWREETPVGERLVPAPVQEVLSVEWPAGHTLVTEETEYDDEYEVTFPQLVHGDPIADDRACFTIAFNEDTQNYWVIDLDDERPDDPMVYVIDHDVPDDEDLFDDPQRLSQMLAGLAVFQPPPEALFPRACARGDLGAVSEALRAGASVGPVNGSGLTPLHLAAISRSVEVVGVLVDGGADPNAAIMERGDIGRDYIHPDWHFGGSKDPGATPLHYAVDSHGPRLRSMPQVVADVVQALLAAGADPTARDACRRTPLHVAAFRAETQPVDADQIEAMRMLLAAGCDPDCEDGFGNTPLIRAASQPELVRVLLDAGVHPARLTGSELWDVLGLSAVHYAALAHWAPEESLRLMLGRVTDPDIRTATGLTPLHCAIRRGQLGPVEVLVRAGADVNAQLDDPHGLKPGLRSHTPLSVARELGHHDVTAFLSNMGATGDGVSP